MKRNHARRGQLQALLDEELTGHGLSVLGEHVATCTACSLRLERMRQRAEDFADALAVLDEAKVARGAAPQEMAVVHDVATKRFRSRGDRRRAWARARLVRAAILLLTFAGVAAAVVPASPLGRWVREVGRQLSGPPTTPRSAPPTQAPGEFAISLPAAEGALSISVRGFAAGSTVRVQLVPETLARVRVGSSGEAPHFETGPGRIEVTGTGRREVRIDLPRIAEEAIVQVDGLPVVRKEGGGLRLLQPPSDSVAEKVDFQVGS